MTHDEWLRMMLAKHRHSSGRSARGLAKHLGIDPSAVSRMASGARRIQIEELKEIASYFGESAPFAGGVQARTDVSVPAQVVQ